MNAKHIVSRLLESDDLSDKAAHGYVDAVANEAQRKRKLKEKLQLATFKRQAKNYIKWVLGGDEADPTELKLIEQTINKAATFDEARKILAKYDGDPSFMEMIGRGHF